MTGARSEAGAACPPEERLAALACDDLTGPAALAVASHLADCEACRQVAVEHREVGRAVGAQRDVLRWHAFPSPFGRMWVAASPRGLVRVSWQQRGDAGFETHLRARHPDAILVRDPEALAAAEAQLREYFGGRRDRFDLPVDLEAMSAFDRRVLEAVRDVGFGQVVPYAELARRIGRPRAARAVGGALGRNPVAIVVPCHRVVRSDGGLGGYGGGVEYKVRLLAIEGRDDLPAVG